MPTAWENRISSLNPVFWVKFDGTGLPTNSGSNGATLTLGNGSHPSAVTALSNTGYTFTTTNAARYDISTFAANTLSDKVYTIETVFKITPGTTNAFQTIWRCDNGNNSIIIRVPGTGGNVGKVEVYLCGNAGTGVNYFSSTRVDDGSYHHVALVADGSNMHLYVDGFRHQIAAYPVGTLNLDTAGSRLISNAPGEISHNLTIDELVIHNSALSSTDIYNNMKTVLPTLAELSKIGGYTTTRPLIYASADEVENSTTVYNTAGSITTKSNTASSTLTKTSSGGPGTINLGHYGTTPSGWSNGFTLGNSYGSFTIGWWFKRIAAPPSSLDWNPQQYIDTSNHFGDNSSGSGWSLNTNGTLTVRFRLNATTYALTTTSNICNNTWKHIIITKNGTTMTLYVNGVSEASTSITTAGLGNATTYWPYTTNGAVAMAWDQFFIYPAGITSTQANDLYVAGFGGVDLNYTNTSGATASATSPNATWSAETVINVTYNSGTLTASADIVDPALSISSNLDAFGFMSVDPALFVDPDISVEKYNDYSASAATAEATSVNVTVSTTRAVDYSASPATVSALFGGNVYAGQTVQDTNYEFNIRRFNSIANQATISQMVDATMTSGTWAVNSRLAIKQISGVPTYNQIIKARLRVDSPFYTYGTNLGNPRFNIYVFTSNPKNGKTFDTMLAADMPDKELLYTTRTIDESGNGVGAEDLTQALQDSRAATYGIMIELAQYDQNGNNLADGYYGWTWAASNYTEITKDWFYILTSEFTSKNINSDPMNVTNAEMTAATVSVERYVNYSQTAATASGLFVHPTIITEGTINFPADPSTASALSIEPALFFGAEVNAGPMIAFGQIQNVVVTAIKNVNIQVDANTVTALLHMPQAQIGENNSVDHMNADALFVMPLIVINESVDAMTTTASATMTDATVAGQLLGVIFAAPMTANAMSPNPPAYIDLFSDPWYATLYAQHSVRNQLPAGYNTAFLKLFEDQNTDITQSTPNTTPSGATRTLRQLRNNLTHGIVVNSGPENDGNIFPNCTVVTDYSTPANESRLSVGYFDPFGRKAVRFQNVAAQMTGVLTHARSDFTLEFSIKTTKANQVISYGDWLSPTGPGRVKTTFNLVDGKLNLFTRSGYYITHPKEVLTPEQIAMNSGYNSVTGNTRIDDNQWHHIVIQYRQGPEDAGDVAVGGRTQIWIDGNLDIQRFGQNIYEPDFIGANLELSTYAPDFYTSAWSADSSFIAERDIDLHYFDYIKYEPILASPMTASLTMTQDNNGFGNRGRALMLYWWPTSSGQNKNFITSRFDSPTYSGQGEFDINMFDNDLETLDFIKNPPQQYYGWDIFPVDITGYFVSDLVKEEAYGGPQNIIEQDLGGAVLAAYEGARPKFKANRMGYFRNTLDDTRRYLDLVNDIDLSKFDAIMFKNYPDQSNEVDAFARNEYVDPYFEIRETKIYQDFIKSLRAAVDTGISLMVNNPQLALDLKIVDRIEIVPDLTDGSGYYSDPYTPTILPGDAAGLPVGTGSTTNIWTDTYRNNRIRIINTVPGITDERSIIYTDAAYWNNDDTLNYGGPNRGFKGFTYKPNGLAVGDEFFISTFNFGNYSGGGGSVSRNYLATPIANVKAGTPITAFANQYRRGLDLVDNPYKNHITSIAIKPGDVLDGRQVGGKIWVNFTDAINQENDYVAIDAIHSEWINLAYQEGSISLELRNQLLASNDLLENKLNQGLITQDEYMRLSRWESNGMYILTQASQIENDGGKDDFSGDRLRKEKITKTSKGGLATNRTVSFGGQFFAFTYARQFLMLAFEAISMNTRGFRWLSNRIEDVNQTQAHTAMPASAAMIQPTVTAVKDASVNAATMIANAVHVDAVGFAGANRNILSLPMTVTALITQPVRIVSAAPMTATADTRQNIVIRTTAQDQVVVYVLHEDPILYLREDIIK